MFVSSMWTREDLLVQSWN